MWALSLGVAAVLEEALVSVLVLALVSALARRAFSSLFSGRAWAQWVATWSAPSLARSALQQTAVRVARVVAVVLKNSTQLLGAVW